MEMKLEKAIAPKNLGGALHLSRYTVAMPSTSWNATMHKLLIDGIVQKIHGGFYETDHQADQRAMENATQSIKQLNASMEAGMAQMRSLGNAIGMGLAKLMGTLSKDIEAEMPIECSSVYKKPIGDANVAIDGLQRNIQMKLSKLTSGARVITELFKSMVDQLCDQRPDRAVCVELMR